MPPQYFIKVVSDRWLQAETVLPVSFKHLILPEKFAPPTELQDMHSKLVRELNFKEAEDIYLQEGIKEFNAIESQAFNKLYMTDESVFVGASSDLTLCAELAILREIQQETFEKIVYIAPDDGLCKIKLNHWRERFSSLQLDV